MSLSPGTRIIKMVLHFWALLKLLMQPGRLKNFQQMSLQWESSLGALALATRVPRKYVKSPSPTILVTEFSEKTEQPRSLLFVVYAASFLLVPIRKRKSVQSFEASVEGTRQCQCELICRGARKTLCESFSFPVAS